MRFRGILNRIRKGRKFKRMLTDKPPPKPKEADIREFARTLRAVEPRPRAFVLPGGKLESKLKSWRNLGKNYPEGNSTVALNTGDENLNLPKFANGLMVIGMSGRL